MSEPSPDPRARPFRRKCIAAAFVATIIAFSAGRMTGPSRASIDEALIATQQDYGDDPEAISEICSAILESREVRLRYRGGGWRSVQPRFLGVTARGSVLLHTWQVSGYSESGGMPGFRNFTFVLIDEYRATRTRVAGPPLSSRWPSGVVEDLCE